MTTRILRPKLNKGVTQAQHRTSPQLLPFFYQPISGRSQLPKQSSVLAEPRGLASYHNPYVERKEQSAAPTKNKKCVTINGSAYTGYTHHRNLIICLLNPPEARSQTTDFIYFSYPPLLFLLSFLSKLSFFSPPQGFTNIRQVIYH